MHRKSCPASLRALSLCALHSSATGGLHNNPIAGKFFACNITRTEALLRRSLGIDPLHFAQPRSRRTAQ